MVYRMIFYKLLLPFFPATLVHFSSQDSNNLPVHDTTQSGSSYERSITGFIISALARLQARIYIIYCDVLVSLLPSYHAYVNVQSLRSVQRVLLLGIVLTNRM
jgi:hypothetical protein